MQVMQQMAEVYRTQPERSLQFAEELVDAMKQVNPIVENTCRDEVTNGQKKPFMTRADLHRLKTVWMDQIDFKWERKKIFGQQISPAKKQSLSAPPGPSSSR